MTRAAGRCQRPTPSRSCGSARSSPAGRAATRTPTPTSPLSAGHPRRADGFAGAQHPGIVFATARLARGGPRLGRSGARRRRRRSRSDERRADRSGRRRSRRRPVRRVRRCTARAQGLLHAGPPRLAVRLAWVSAELAMATGDGATAVGHAERAVELLRALGSARHSVKSDVVLAAALCSDGLLDRSRAGGRRRAGHHAATRLGPAELGVGVPARRNRQREPLR